MCQHWPLTGLMEGLTLVLLTTLANRDLGWRGRDKTRRNCLSGVMSSLLVGCLLPSRQRGMNVSETGRGVLPIGNGALEWPPVASSSSSMAVVILFFSLGQERVFPFGDVVPLVLV